MGLHMFKVPTVPEDETTDDSIFITVSGETPEEAIGKIYTAMPKMINIDKDGYDPLWSRYYC